MCASNRESFWGRAARREAGLVTGGLAGEAALAAFLAQTGYGSRPEGLAARVALELSRALPLAGSSGFAKLFDAKETVARARAEGTRPYPGQPAEELAPAGLAEPLVALREDLWPWASGQRVCRLARAARLPGGAVEAKAALKDLAEFMRQNPPLMGPAWADPQIVAVRALNWLFALAFLGEHLSGDPTAVATCLLHLGLMAEVLTKALADPLEAYHFGPAAGLYFLSFCLPVLQGAEFWQQLALAKLGPALGLAVDSPAPGLSPAALAQWAGLALWLAGKGKPEPAGLAENLAGPAGFCRAAAPPYLLNPPTVPGAPDVLSLDQAPANAWAADLAALLLKNSALRAGRQAAEPLYWLLGEACAEGLRQLVGGGPPQPADSASAGLCGLCGQAGKSAVGVWLSTQPRDDAPPDPDGRPRLDQAGALGLSLCLGGKAVFTFPDPHLPEPDRFAFYLDDAPPDQSGRVSLEVMRSGDNARFLCAAYDGWEEQAHPVRLRRRIHLDVKRRTLTLVDQIAGHLEHNLARRFFLPAGSRVEQGALGELLLSGEFGLVKAFAEPRCQVEARHSDRWGARLCLTHKLPGDGAAWLVIKF